MKLSPETADAVQREVDRAALDDVRTVIAGRIRWRKVCDACEALSKLCSGLATILAFAGGAFGYKSLSFVSGTSGTVGIVLLAFAGYSAKESKERTTQLNAMLAEIGLERVPDIAVLPEEN